MTVFINTSVGNFNSYINDIAYATISLKKKSIAKYTSFFNKSNLKTNIFITKFPYNALIG